MVLEDQHFAPLDDTKGKYTMGIKYSKYSSKLGLSGCRCFSRFWDLDGPRLFYCCTKHVQLSGRAHQTKRPIMAEFLTVCSTLDFERLRKIAEKFFLGQQKTAIGSIKYHG